MYIMTIMMPKNCPIRLFMLLNYKITDEKLNEVVYAIMMMDADPCMEMDRIELVNYIENMLCIKLT